MGPIDKFLTYMKINGEDDEFYDDDYDDEEEVSEPAKARIVKADFDDEPEIPRKPAKVTQMRTVKKIGGSGMEVCVLKPTSVEEARTITETLLSDRTVVLNMEGLEMEIAQRIIDFASGSCYAINGRMQKISHYIFIITPPSVDITGDFQDILGDSYDVTKR